MARWRPVYYTASDGKRYEIPDNCTMPRAARKMDNAAVLTWCQRDTWRRLGGRGGCPWVGERDNTKPPKAKSNADQWKAERAAYLRLFAPYTPRSALTVQPWAGGEHLHRCPACECQPRREAPFFYNEGYHIRQHFELVYKQHQVEPREAPHWWCDVPDADCPHPWEHPCREHDPESAVNRQSAERGAEDAAHEEAGGGALGECYDEGEAESGPNGIEEGRE